jgi:hypothetical protein
MPILVVSERPDMDYDISLDGKLQHVSVARKNLKRQLAPYLIEEKYSDVMRQLAGEGKATVEIPSGKFEQL